MTDQRYEQLLFKLGITGIVIFVIFLPIYVYGLIRFWQYRHHIIIAKRFPSLCLIIAACSFLNGFTFSIQIWIEYTGISIRPAFANGFAFFVYGLINLRLNLVYLRWKQHRQLLQSTDPKAAPTQQSVVDALQHEPANCNSVGQKMRNVFLHGSSVCLFVFGFLGFVWITFGPLIVSFSVYVDLMAPLWTLQLLITMIIIVIIMYNKVQDGIGCLNESALNLVLSACIVITVPVLAATETHFFVSYFIFVIAPYFQGVIPLYGGLYVVYKMSVRSENRPISARSASNLASSKTSERKKRLAALEQPLEVFLTKKDNYQMLKEYLSHCWALENLLFLQKVCIMKQILKRSLAAHAKPANTESATAIDGDTAAVHMEHKADPQADEEATNVPFECAFAYLSDVYQQYNRLTQLDDSDEKEVAKSWNTVCKSIYFEFIANGSEKQVNVSYPCRLRLLSVFDSHDEGRMLSVSELFHVFDLAVDEIHWLIVSMYHYNFRTYVLDKYPVEQA